MSRKRDFMMSLSDDKQADVIDAVNTTSRYLDNILNINNVYFDNMPFRAPTFLVLHPIESISLN